MSDLTVKVLGSDVYKAVHNYLHHSDEFKALVRESADVAIKKHVDRMVTGVMQIIVENAVRDVKVTVEKELRKIAKAEIDSSISAIVAGIFNRKGE